MRGVSPDQIAWRTAGSGEVLPELFNELTEESSTSREAIARVPKEFIDLAKLVIFHRDQSHWAVLYRTLFRLTHGEPHLLNVAVDDDIAGLNRMHRSVRRDIHKMHAFVRFRRIEQNGEEHFIAWHRPDHLIIRNTAPWFANRFATMRWTILTPDESASWDRHQLCFHAGVPRSAAPQADELESLWKTYYAATFNPARIKIRAMKKELPVRHWATLLETELIDELLKKATIRVDTMIAKSKSQPVGTDGSCKPTSTSAAEFVPHSHQLKVLRAAAAKCEGCALYCNATQVVFGAGPADARCIFVGEQPGDQEDLAGKPFVGPAGQLLDRALEEAGIDRSLVYVTNAVKHFKFDLRGKRRIHAKPSAREISACRPWLEAEIASIKPDLVVCLGATAAQSLMGREFRITKDRGRAIHDTEWANTIIATIHPSAILRTPAEDRDAAYSEFLRDLKVIRQEMKRLGS